MLIHTATICSYSIIHVGIRELNWVNYWLTVTFHHLLFAPHSHSNGVQTWGARELGAAEKTSTVVIALC